MNRQFQIFQTKTDTTHKETQFSSNKRKKNLLVSDICLFNSSNLRKEKKKFNETNHLIQLK